MAGWLKKQRFAERVMCRSSRSAWRANNKFKSTCRKCVWRICSILTMHETDYGNIVSTVRERQFIGGGGSVGPVEKCSDRTIWVGGPAILRGRMMVTEQASDAKDRQSGRQKNKESHL